MANKIGEAFIEVEPRVSGDYSRGINAELAKQYSKINVNLPPLKMTPGWENQLNKEIGPKLRAQMAETRREVERGLRLGAVSLGPGWNREIDQKLTTGVRDAIGRANAEAKVKPTFEITPQFRQGISQMRSEISRSNSLGTINLGPGWDRQIDAEVTRGVKAAITKATSTNKITPQLDDSWKSRIGPQISTDMRFAILSAGLDKMMIPGPKLDSGWGDRVFRPEIQKQFGSVKKSIDDSIRLEPRIRPNFEMTPEFRDGIAKMRAELSRSNTLGTINLGPGWDRQIDAEMSRGVKAAVANASKNNKINIDIDVDTERSGASLRSIRTKATTEMAGAGVDAGFSFAKELGNTLAALPSSFMVRALMTPLGPAILVVAITLAAAIATVVVPALGAALLAGLGGGAIAGGIALALNDARVDQSLVQFKNKVGESMKGIVDIFAGATQGSLIKLGDIFTKTIQPSLLSMAQTLAPMMDSITDGIGGFVKELLPGLQIAIEEIEPILATVVEHLPKLGESVGRAFAMMGEHSDALAKALDLVLLAIESVIETIALWVVIFGETFAAIGAGIVDFLGLLANALDLLSKIPGLDEAGYDADKLRDAAKAVDSLGSSATITGGSVRILSDETQSAEEKQKGLADALAETNKQLKEQYDLSILSTENAESWNTKLISLKDSMGKLGGTLDITTKAGLSNRDSLQEAAKSTRDLYLADIEAGVPMDEALRRHEVRIQVIKDEAKAHNADMVEVGKLLGLYGAIPTDIGTILRLTGSEDVVRKINELLVKQIMGRDGVGRGRAEDTLNKGKWDGGFITGPGGPTADRAGVFPLSDGEFVQRASAVQHYGRSFMEALNKKQVQVDGIGRGFAAGGFVRRPQGQNLSPLKRTGPASVEWPFPIKSEDFKTDDFKNYDTGDGLGVGSLGGAGGGIAKILALAKASGIPHKATSTFRPGSRAGNGNLDWHSKGNAVDFGGFNQDRFAQYWMGMSGALLELIHRSNTKSYGVSKGRPFTGNNEQLFNEHRDHVHVAMHGDANTVGGGSLNGGKPGGATAGLAPGAIRDALKLGGAARAWLATAAARTGVPGWQVALQSLAWRESGGNPGAKSFASNGGFGYAIGLIQLLESTFQTFRDKSLPGGRTDPVANAVAGINWIKHKYGTIFNLPHAVGENPSPGGYDNGGPVPPGQHLIDNSSGKTETMLNHAQGVAFEKRIAGDGEQTIELTLNLGEGIEQVYQLKIDRTNSDTARVMRAGRKG